MEDFELDNMYKENHFKVPNGYFEAFDSKLQSRLYTPPVKLNVWPNFMKWSAAAAVLMVSGLGLYFYFNASSQAIDISKAQISPSELERFSEENEVSDDELMELVSVKSIDSIYRLEVKTVSNKENNLWKSYETIEEEYTPLEDEIEI